jgi:hypothetical protein
MKLIQKFIICIFSLLLAGVAPVDSKNVTDEEIGDYTVGAFEASSIDMFGDISIDNDSILFNCTILPADERHRASYDNEIDNQYLGDLIIEVLRVAELVERKYPNNIEGARIFIRDPEGSLVAHANFAAFNHTIHV